MIISARDDEEAMAQSMMSISIYISRRSMGYRTGKLAQLAFIDGRFPPSDRCRAFPPPQRITDLRRLSAAHDGMIFASSALMIRRRACGLASGIDLLARESNSLMASTGYLLL